MAYFAHKGYTIGGALPNSLDAYVQGVINRVPALEMDVWAIEGELLLGHDEEEARLPGASKLRQVLQAITSRAENDRSSLPVVNIEIKGAGVSKPLASMLNGVVTNSSWLATNFLVSTFTKKAHLLRELEVLRDNAALPLAIIVTNPRKVGKHLKRAQQLGACSIHVKHKRTLCPTYFATVAGSAPFSPEVYVWTVNAVDDMNNIMAMGARGFFTDRPDFAERTLRCNVAQ